MRDLDKRQQKPTMHTEFVDTENTCLNCGTFFIGRFCPQCGLRANRQRMKAKNVVLEFLELWDIELDRIYRTLYEMFWRPGYMMRDYLRGRKPFYFSPFKLIIFTTLFFAIVSALRGIETDDEDVFIYGDVFQRYGGSQFIINLFANVDKMLLWLDANPAYSTIASGIFYIVASWLVFLRQMKFVEVFITQFFISNQMQIVGTLWVLITGSEAYYNVPPFAVPFVIGLPLLSYDYAQLYNLRAWAAVWRTILTFVLTLILMLAVGTLPIFLVKIF